MRISLLLAAIVAATAVGPDSVSAQGNTAPRTTAPPAGASKQGTSVAVIDVGYIFKNARRFKQTMEDIKLADEKFQEELVRRRDAINASIQKLQQMQKGDPNYKLLEEQIAGDQTKLRLDVARAQKERIEKEAKVYFNAYKEVEDHITKFSGRYGIDLVLRFNSEAMDPTKPESVLSGINRFVVFQRQLNITGHILDEMNRNTPDRPARNANGAARTNFPPRPTGGAPPARR